MDRSLAQAWFARGIVPAAVLTPLLWPVSPAGAVAAMLGAHLSLFYGTFLPNRQSFGPVATGFRGAPDEVWLTIDDGPDLRDTPRILDALDAAGARATFFVRGDRARAHPELVREMVGRGNTVGNHTFSHPQRSFWGLPPSRLGAEMDQCSDVLREITGADPRWFRAPVGMVNPYVHRAAAERGMRVVGWSARAFDAGRSAVATEMVVARVGRDLRPGGIALLHEGVPSAAQNVAGVLERLREKGWRAVVPDYGDL